MKNKTKNSFLKLLILILLSLNCISCTGDEGTVDPQHPDPLEAISHKKFKVVGYFNGLTRGGVTPDYYNLRDIPEGVDIVNLFHRFSGLCNLKRGDRTPGATGEDAKTLTEIVNDIQYLKSKGTIVVQTQFLNEIFENYKDERKTIKFQNTPEDYDAYAKKVSDSLNKWGFDGIDLDLEPGYSTTGIDSNDWDLYVQAFAKYFGPKSKSGKLLIIDTNVGLSELKLSQETLTKISSIYIQDYWGSEAYTDGKIDGYVQAGFPKERIMLISADFEAAYSSTDSSQGPLRLKQYYTSPKYQSKVGGYGAYGFNFDKKLDYKYYQEMIVKLKTY
ncbi:EndoS/ChiA family endoglycosidase [Chryseobacterium rhizosphaerae]|uniref:mannosyl-glycoprotein endo-beta-N-acetylglucosaminidase n=1 Tax=Chryseobacterium rhizosphaerae TaxID=395937 RepID=A0ABX9IQD0_9FLAO|nr:glycosyl hydrolase family 18 protein [Chryseobacterium rhizosphaerae]REC78289.1 hypothetical protein DRF57_02320 [Chryseobacterium rhizosphaerae]GEN66576.1 hypothetical protein CRH01_11440 [Chryseobacterium rhizosphaerae]